MHRIGAAFYLLLLLDIVALATVAAFWRVRMQAGLLLVPYVAWLLFATVLNWQVLQLNPQADGSEYSGAVQRIEL